MKHLPHGACIERGARLFARGGRASSFVGVRRLHLSRRLKFIRSTPPKLSRTIVQFSTRTAPNIPVRWDLAN